MNYEFNLLNYVGVVAKRVCAAGAAAETAAHKGDDNTLSGQRAKKCKHKLNLMSFKMCIKFGRL